MKKICSILLALSFIMVGCGSSKSLEEKQKQDDNTVTDTVKEDEASSSEKTGENNQADKKEGTSKETSKKDSASSTKPSSSNESKKTDNTSSKTTKPSEPSSDKASSSDKTASSDKTTTKPSTPKEDSKPEAPVEPVKKWAMSETEMIEYAKKCVINYKPTSGYGKCEWAEEFNKNNSGWFESTTLKISKTKNQLQDLIKVTVDSTLEKTTSQVLDDGKGNIDKEAIYAAKGYLEKVDNEQYKFYVFY